MLKNNLLLHGKIVVSLQGENVAVHTDKEIKTMTTISNNRKVLSMKSKSMLLFAIVIASAFAGCTKEGDTVTLGVKVDGWGKDSKITIDNNRTPQWSQGDGVWINNAHDYTITADANSVQINGVTRASDGQYYAVFPSDIVPEQGAVSDGSVPVKLPRCQTFVREGNSQKVGVPMMAHADNSTVLNFKNLCSLVKVTVHNGTGANMTLDSITITASTTKLCGATSARIQNNNAVLEPITNGGENTVSLVFGSDEQIQAEDDGEYYISLPEFGADEVAIIVFANGNRYFPVLKSSVYLEHNSIAQVTLAIDALLEIKESFAVTRTKNVRFSKGNLQYSRRGSHAVVRGTADGTWRFAEHQYDFIGSGNSAIYNSDDMGWFDLFGWGTSGWNSYARDYMPTSTDDNGACYIVGNSNSNGLTGNYANADWGVYNAISNGGNLPSQWRTLTKDEWNRILFTRSGCTNNRRYTKNVTINSCTGIIIYPNSYTMPNIGMSTTGAITCSLAKWAILEAGGCVFLPPTSYRRGTIISSDLGLGYYWTTTPVSSGYYLAYCLRIGGDFEPIFESRTREYGFAVRLVQDIN